MRQDIKDYIVKFEDIAYNRESVERVLTGFQDLDYFNKGIETGLTEIIGDTNVGKSVFVSSLINNAITQHYKVGVFAGEHSLQSYKNLVMQQNGKKGEFVLVPFKDTNGRDTNIADWYVNEEAEKRISQKFNGNLYLYNVIKEERDVDTILQAIEYGSKEYGIRFWVIDNLMELKNDNENQWQEQTAIGNKLRNMFVQHNMFGVLVMHTAKNDNLRLNIRNAFGSSNITNKAYRVWTLYRKDYIFARKGQEKELEKMKEDLARNGFDYDKCDAFVDTIKSKGNGNGIIGLKYDSETKTYSQAEKITKTEADKIIRTTYKQQSIGFDDFISFDNNKGTLPF